MKRQLALIGVGVVFVIVALLAWSATSWELVGKDVRLAVFTTGEEKKAIVYIPFDEDVNRPVHATLSIGDGTVAQNISIRPRQDGRIGIPATLKEVPKVGAMLHISIAIEGEGEQSFEREIKEVVMQEKDLLELDKVTDPENSMKGTNEAGVKMAQPATEASRLTPDIGQRIAECAPTSAANSLISLVEEHGDPEKMPSDSDLINELKGDMDWTPENGVLPEDFVAGKNKWAARHGFPIRTRIVGDQHGRGSLEGILDAMAQGNSAGEIRIKFAQNGKVKGGHMVAVTGIRVEGDQTFIDVSDPRTPEGTDTYEVNGNLIEGYPYDGQAILSWGFVQTWEGTPTGTALDPMTDAEMKGIQDFVGEKEMIQVIVVQGKKIPLSLVHVGKGQECTEGGKEMPHYHANDGSATAIDGTNMVDSGGCGYGMVKNIPVEKVPKP